MAPYGRRFEQTQMKQIEIWGLCYKTFIFSINCGDGPVVSVLVFNSNYPSSNLAGYLNFL